VTVLLKYNDYITISIDLVPCIKFPSKYLYQLPPFKDEIKKLLERVFIQQHHTIPSRDTLECIDSEIQHNTEDNSLNILLDSPNQTVKNITVEECTHDMESSSGFQNFMESTAPKSIALNNGTQQGRKQDVTLECNATIHTEDRENAEQKKDTDDRQKHRRVTTI
jgi:hypothetical protein